MLATEPWHALIDANLDVHNRSAPVRPDLRLPGPAAFRAAGRGGVRHATGPDAPCTPQRAARDAQAAGAHHPRGAACAYRLQAEVNNDQREEKSEMREATPLGRTLTRTHCNTLQQTIAHACVHTPTHA